MSRLTKIIGKRIARERRHQGLSQENLADQAGLQMAYLGRVERGEYSVGIDNLKKIALALNLPLEILFKNY